MLTTSDGVELAVRSWSAIGEPRAAGGFSEGRSGNAGQFHLPALKFGLGQEEPIAGLQDFRQGS